MKLLWNSHGEWPKGSLETHCGKTCHLWGVIRNVFWQNVSPMTTDWRHINLEMDFFYPHWDMSRVSNKDFLHSDPSTLRPLIRSYLCCRGIYGRSTRKTVGGARTVAHTPQRSRVGELVSAAGHPTGHELMRRRRSPVTVGSMQRFGNKLTISSSS